MAGIPIPLRDTRNHRVATGLPTGQQGQLRHAAAKVLPSIAGRLKRRARYKISEGIVGRRQPCKNRSIVHRRHIKRHLHRTGRGQCAVPCLDRKRIQRAVRVRRRRPTQRFPRTHQRRARRHRRPRTAAALFQRPRAHRFHPETQRGALRVRLIRCFGQRLIADRQRRVLGRAREGAHRRQRRCRMGGWQAEQCE